MICNNCGTANNEDAKFCKNCGNNLAQGETTQPEQTTQQAQQTQTQTQTQVEQHIQYVTPEKMPRVENYLVFSILVTLLCCLPLGIAAIIKSSQVDKELAIGNYEGALAASKQAKTFNLIGVISGGVFVLIWVVVTFILPLLLAFGL